MRVREYRVSRLKCERVRGCKGERMRVEGVTYNFRGRANGRRGGRGHLYG
jgi:hypothetical protein